MTTKHSALTVLFLTILLSCATGQQKFSKLSEDSLLTLLEKNNKAMGSLAVMENGKLIYTRAIGFSAVSPDKVPSTEKTRYRIGSISKMFTATMIFQLIEENKLQLTTTLDKFFPSVKNSVNITIGNMLNHRSGIHSFTDDPAYRNYMTKAHTKSEMVELISSSPSDFEPGSKFQYSNSNYVLLGYIAENLRKESYESILQKYICSKAGLTDTHLGEKTDLSKNESFSFRFTGGWDQLPETDMSIPQGAGAIVSTTSDLVIFITALFDGKLVKPSSLEKMKTISDGMGMGMQQLPYESKTVYGHGGGIDGFNSLLMYIPEDKLAVAYCSNGTNYAVNDIILHTLGNYYGKPVKLPVFNAYMVKPSDLDKYPGVYSNPGFPLKLTITANDGRLFGQGSGQPPFPLEATAKDEFKFDMAGIVIRFNTDSSKLDLLQGGKNISFSRESNP
jgi:D-alanyl-D-alanine carboxypeptidase